MPDEMEEIIAEFVAESEETLEEVDPLFVELEQKGFDKDVLNRLFRCVHTVKGAAGFLGFQQIVDVAHAAENVMKRLRDAEIAPARPLIDAVLGAVDTLRALLSHIRSKDGKTEDTAPVIMALQSALDEAEKQPGPGGVQRPGQNNSSKAEDPPAVLQNAENEKVVPDKGGSTGAALRAPAPDTEKRDDIQTLRVDIEKIDKVLNLTGEVVLARNRLINIASRLERRQAEDREVLELVEAVSFLDLIASDMQIAVMKMRMQPLRRVFGKFPRLVRDIASPLGKQVELCMFGEDTEVDKSVIERLGDPLVHIIRNAVDHGIEPPSERTAKGKPERGMITIRAFQKGNQIIIEISDDGRGIDIERVKEKAIEKGIITQDEALRMSDEAAIGIIFLPGFSTAEKATEISGRGVGMDVVKTNVAKLNGSVDASSRPGHGSTFTIRLPLTVAIIQTLMVRSSGAQYAIPLSPVEETLLISEKDISGVGGMDTVIVRGKVYPLFDLSVLLGHPAREKAAGRYALVIAIGEARFALRADEVLGQEEVVIKTPEGIVAKSPHILGATITGNGRVVFILDLASIASSALGAARV